MFTSGVVEHLKKSRGRISLLLQQFREVGSDGRALGAFLGGVESQFGKVVANELLSLAPKLGIDLKALVSEEAVEARKETRPPDGVEQTFTTASNAGDLEKILNVLSRHPGLFRNAGTDGLIVQAIRSEGSVGLASFEKLSANSRACAGCLSDALIRACVEVAKDADVVDRIVIEVASSNAAAGEDTFALLLRKRAQIGNGPKVNGILKAMKAKGVDLNDKLAKEAMSAFGRCAAIERIDQFYRTLERRNASPAMRTEANRARLTAHVLNSDMPKAMEHFEKIESPCESDFIRVAQGWIAASQPRKALMTLDSMRQRRLEMDSSSYEVALSIYAALAHSHGVESVLEEMSTKRIRCDTNAYESAMRGLYIAGDKAGVARLYRRARQHFPEPTESMLLSLIAAYVRNDELGKVQSISSRLITAGWRPGIKTANFLLKAYASRGCVEHVDALFAKFSLLKLQPTSETFEALMLAKLHAGDSVSAIRTYRDFRHRSLEARPALFRLLLKATHRIGQRGQVRAILSEMLEKGLEVDNATFKLMIQCTFGDVEEICFLLEEMVARDLSLTPSLLVALLDVLPVSGSQQEASAVVQTIESMEPMIVDEETLPHLMRALRRVGRDDLAKKTFYSVKERDRESFLELVLASPTTRSAEISLEEAFTSGFRNESMLAAVVKKYADEGNIDSAVNTWKKMRIDDASAYSEALLYLSELVSGDWVKDVLRSSPRLMAQDNAWLAVTRAYTREKQFSRAIETIRKCFNFKSDGARLAQMYEELLGGLAKAGQLRRAQRMFKVMRRRQVPTTPKTLSYLIEAAGNDRDAESVVDLIRIARQRHLHLDSRDVSKAIDTASKLCGLLPVGGP
ncbi:hypothetical protein NDN08_002427 [Rhodosorus marinus]|uniref:Pentacotripeptide-repeat region of PRORP domain-containing protein n=1 Tax=Rhodosorus marinus TaxID=101924 RepID=A0AAV8UWI4_9RHOD|nr:hypothetical protein NDN08_002427 [Rhodosorus marinus]